MQKIQGTLTDDLDDSEATETLSFSLEGSQYEIDVNKKNADKLRKALAPYIEHARPVRALRSVPAPRARTRNKQGADIRSWARENGMKVNERGRVPAEVVAKYEAAQAS